MTMRYINRHYLSIQRIRGFSTTMRCINRHYYLNLLVGVLFSHIKCHNVLLWHRCTYGNICDTRQVHDVDKQKQRLTRSGMAWDKVQQMIQWTTGTNVSWHVSCKRRAFSAFNKYANVQKHIYVIALNTSTELLLLIFCISQGSVVTHLRCGGKYDTSLVVNLLRSPRVKEF